MRRAGIVIICGFVLLLVVPSLYARERAERDGISPSDKMPSELVIDGSVFHNVGQVWLNITNWGLIGSQPSSAAPYSDAPSARWPAEDGLDYLWSAGLWVGAVKLGEPHVTTGQFELEWRPTDDPIDTIYTMARGDPGGSRYPFPLPDDDGDGLEDEDPKNGLDDDGDGLIDEDFAAISDQHFRCANSDTAAILSQTYPDHESLGLEVIQQSFQWSHPLADDFVGFEFTIRHHGITTLENVYLGFFADCDIPASADGADDDWAGYWAGQAEASDGSWVEVRMAYMHDGSTTSPAPGYIGFILLDHTTDPGGTSAPVEPGVRSFQHFRSQQSFDMGGDPTNDSERYAALSVADIDPDPPGTQLDDYRVLISSGPFVTLAPGEELTYQVAIVLGEGLEGLIMNAAEAVLTYQGQFFDRDEDPANGQEYQVHWLRPEEVPVGAIWGELQSRYEGGELHLEIRTDAEQPSDLQVRRQVSAAGASRTWHADEFASVIYLARGMQIELVDEDPVGWPRHYVLIYSVEDRLFTLDELELSGPPQLAAHVAAHPNPFNPRVEIAYAVPRTSQVELAVFDSRGRKIRTLLSSAMPACEGVCVWDGTDATGRGVASGVYHLQLVTEYRTVRQSVTLLR